MKIAHFSTSETMGGAAHYANKLHRGLLHSGIESKLYVRYIASKNIPELYELRRVSGILENKILPKIRSIRKKSLLRQYTVKPQTPFSWNKFLTQYSLEEEFIQQADLIKLYWIGEFLEPENLKNLKQPIIWSLMDTWPFTGGCHYPGNCDGFKHNCGSCPAIQSNDINDESKTLLSRKLSAFEKLDITIVAPSNWIADLAAASTLFRNRRIEVIRTGVDEKHFKPLSKVEMRKAFSIPKESRLILFGADSAADPRKGIELLLESLRILNKSGTQNIELGIFGRDYDSGWESIGFPVHYFGFVSNLTLPLLYNCADIFVAPSIEENLPNTALEAMACGVPVCGFNIGGMPDLIKTNENGMLANETTAQALATSILATLDNSETFGIKARETICNLFTQDQHIKSYIDLFNSLLKK